MYKHTLSGNSYNHEDIVHFITSLFEYIFIYYLFYTPAATYRCLQEEL